MKATIGVALALTTLGIKWKLRDERRSASGQQAVEAARLSTLSGGPLVVAPGAAGHSCRNTDGVCIANALDRTSCTGGGGTFLAGACPDEHALGVCSLPAGDITVVHYVDNRLNVTAADAAWSCARLTRGTFRRTPGVLDGPRSPPPPATIRASCTWPGGRHCMDISVAGPHDDLCAGLTRASTPCPRENLIGSCVSPDGTTSRHYFEPGTPPAKVPEVQAKWAKVCATSTDRMGVEAQAWFPASVPATAARTIW